MGAETTDNRRVLLIGGGGYIGSVMTEDLLRHGYTVRCIDMFIYGHNVCALPFLHNPSYEFVYGDLTDSAQMASALAGVSDVIILGGLVGDPITKKYPELSNKINLAGISGLIELLDGRGLNRMVFVSTCSNYGLIGAEALADENYELKPMSLYAEAKVAAEKKLLALQGGVDYHPTILRFATAFGLSPRMRFDLTVNEFTRDMYMKKDLLVYDADTWRPYCHVVDFSRAIRQVLEAPLDAVDFEVFNVGSEANNYTKQMLIDAILQKVPDAPVRYQEKGPDPRNYRVSFEKIRAHLQFEPSHTVLDGIAELIDALDRNLFVDVDANRNFYGNYELRYP